MIYLAISIVATVAIVCFTWYKVITHCNHSWNVVSRRSWRDSADTIDLICEKCGKHKRIE